jgi:alpha-L-fucosidase
MKNRLFIIFFIVLYSVTIQGTFSQDIKYKANWGSIDSRPVPEWFGEAKFGIFIHWGPYSVPAYTPKGTYSEWYQYWLENKTLFGNGNFTGQEVVEYHEKTYGKDFSYYDFGPMFTADLFNPDEWAELFKNAGARYIVITTKHHDGFCLWPSKEANDRGFAWNSMEVGANRDLIGDLTTSVKNAGIKMGFYYSLYEWYHPWWKNDRDRFVVEHFPLGKRDPKTPWRVFYHRIRS